MQQIRNSRRCYYGSVTFVDEWIGNIMNVLKERNLLENTFMYCTSPVANAPLARTRMLTDTCFACCCCC